MTLKTRQEIIAIRDMVQHVAHECATHDEDQMIYHQFGSINRDEASGIVQGINMVLSNTVPAEDIRDNQHIFSSVIEP